MSENKGIHDGHRARVRERFMKSGLDRFTDHQVIELLLYYGIPRKDTNEIAHKLLDTFGSFSAVFDAPAEALMGCGLSYNCAVMLKLIPSVCTRYYNDKFSGKSEDKEKSVVPDLKQLVLPYFIDGTEERLFVVLLDKKGNVVFKDTAVTGASFSSDVSAQKLLRLCVQHKAKGCILAHNHANGSTVPTKKDAELITKLKRSFRSIDAILIDYYIIADMKCLPVSENEEYEYLLF